MPADCLLVANEGIRFLWYPGLVTAKAHRTGFWTREDGDGHDFQSKSKNACDDGHNCDGCGSDNDDSDDDDDDVANDVRY